MPVPAYEIDFSHPLLVGEYPKMSSQDRAWIANTSSAGDPWVDPDYSDHPHFTTPPPWMVTQPIPEIPVPVIGPHDKPGFIGGHPVSDPYNSFPGPPGIGAPAPVGTPVIFAGIGAAIIGGILAVRALIAAGAVRAGARLIAGPAIWSRLPSWLRSGLLAAGIIEGTDFVIDITGLQLELGDGGGGGIVPFPGGGAVVPGGPPSVGMMPGWVANGITFYRLTDGRFAVQRKNGTWKTWKPKKPIVIYASGAKDIPTFLRAERALTKQATRLKKALARAAPSPRRSRAKPQVIDVHVDQHH